jgi:hypothetical protein
MKKIILIIFLVLVFEGSTYAQQDCDDEAYPGCDWGQTIHLDCIDLNLGGKDDDCQLCADVEYRC